MRIKSMMKLLVAMIVTTFLTLCSAIAMSGASVVTHTAKPTHVIACVTTKSVLVNQVKGVCPKGTVKVSIPLTALKGATGPQGPQGIQGAPGQNGAAGSNGVNGTNGTNGAKGDTGSQGAQGIQGPQGVQGVAGQNGTNGTNGVSGYTASVQTQYNNVAAGTYSATCANGYSVVSGGYSDTNATVTGSWPANSNTWDVAITGGSHLNVWVYIVCEIAN